MLSRRVLMGSAGAALLAGVEGTGTQRLTADPGVRLPRFDGGCARLVLVL